MKNASAVTFIVEASGASSIAVVAAETFGGSTTNWTTANGFGQPSVWYQNAKHDGTGGWTLETASWASNALTLAGTSGYVSVVDFFTSQFASGYEYIEVTGTNTTSICAVLHDLTVQRKPANLTILGA